MGNQFIGFPVPRAKIADMIAGSAPPIIHHLDHEKDGDDEVDCTGLEGAGGISLPFDDIYLNELIQNKSCFEQRLSTSGSVTDGSNGVEVSSGNDLNSYGEIRKILWPYQPPLAWSKKRDVTFNVDFALSSTGDDEFWVGNGRHGDYKHIGFKVISQVLYGTCYESAETEVALTGGANPAFAYTGYSLRFVYDGAASVKFYVNGVLRGEITTNIPTGTSYAERLFQIKAITLLGGKHADVTLNSFSFYQKA